MGPSPSKKTIRKPRSAADNGGGLTSGTGTMPGTGTGGTTQSFVESETLGTGMDTGTGTGTGVGRSSRGMNMTGSDKNRPRRGTSSRRMLSMFNPAKQLRSAWSLFSSSSRTIVESSDQDVASPAVQMIDPDEQRVYDAFKMFDKNNDNILSIEEFRDAYIYYTDEKPTQTKLSFMYSQVDRNKDGKIDFKEFKRFLLNEESRNNGYYDMFKKLDKNKDEQISKSEFLDGFKKQIPNLDWPDVDEIFKIADTNHDEHINFSEFINYLKSS